MTINGEHRQQLLAGRVFRGKDQREEGKRTRGSERERGRGERKLWRRRNEKSVWERGIWRARGTGSGVNEGGRGERTRVWLFLVLCVNIPKTRRRWGQHIYINTRSHRVAVAVAEKGSDHRPLVMCAKTPAATAQALTLKSACTAGNRHQSTTSGYYGNSRKQQQSIELRLVRRFIDEAGSSAVKSRTLAGNSSKSSSSSSLSRSSLAVDK